MMRHSADLKMLNIAHFPTLQLHWLRQRFLIIMSKSDHPGDHCSDKMLRSIFPRKEKAVMYRPRRLRKSEISTQRNFLPPSAMVGKVVAFSKKQIIFAQGDIADAIF